MSTTRMLLIGAAVLTTFANVFFAYHLSAYDERASVAALVCVPPVPQLEAKAAAILDIETGVMLFEKNADAQMPLASLTKTMTTLVASRVLGESDTVTITSEALAPEGDAGLYEGERWYTQDLIDFTLITSANDGAHALALASAEKSVEPYEAFIERMNTLARSLNLTQTFFLNDTGLDISSTTAGAYGSARDMTHLFAYVYRNEEAVFAHSALASGTFRSLSGITHKAENTSALTGSLPGQVLSKTGFTDLAGGNLVIVAEPLLGNPVAIAVLGSSREGRDRDAAVLYAYAAAALKRATLCSQK